MNRVVNAFGKLSCGKRVVAVFVLCAMAAIVLAVRTPAHAQTLTTLHHFTAGADGGHSTADLVQATNGHSMGPASARCSKSPPRHADDALHLLFSAALRGRARPRGGADPGRQWEPLRDNCGWRSRQRGRGV
jgi:hypothetical protein